MNLVINIEPSHINFAEDRYHVADGPPYTETLCGINVRGQVPVPKEKPDCRICRAQEKELFRLEGTLIACHEDPA